jgi:hypothetical protein
VSYNAPVRKATFFPDVPLNCATSYTATLDDGIADASGNTLAGGYTWQFTTRSAVHIRVALPPPHEDVVTFAELTVGAGSAETIITVTSGGPDDLNLGDVSLSGTDAGSFRIAGDTCSARTMVTEENCTVRVVFEPDTSGGKTADLHIASNDPNTPDLVVPLTGSAVDDGSGGDGGGGGSGGGCFISTLE